MPHRALSDPRARLRRIAARSRGIRSRSRAGESRTRGRRAGVQRGRHQVPDARLEHQAVRREPSRHPHPAPPLVPHLEDLLVPYRLRDLVEVVRPFDVLEPPGDVQVEALPDPAGPVPELRRERRHQLQLRRREDTAEPELGGGVRRSREEQRLGLVGGEAGEPGAVPAEQAVSAGRATISVDRDARRGQRLDVAVDRPDRDLELGGQLLRRELAPCLEQHQQGEQPTRAHPAILPSFPDGF